MCFARHLPGNFALSRESVEQRVGSRECSLVGHLTAISKNEVILNRNFKNEYRAFFRADGEEGVVRVPREFCRGRRHLGFCDQRIFSGRRPEGKFTAG